MRGGWQAARRDASELLRHRRILVDTPAMTPGGVQVVLRTRVRLTGDTQTDIRRDWLAATTSAEVDTTARAHFASVAAATAGWPAALGMLRISTLLMTVIATVVGAAAAIDTLWSQPIAGLPVAVLSDWHLMVPLVVAALGLPIRWIVCLRLRAWFARASRG